MYRVSSDKFNNTQPQQTPQTLVKAKGRKSGKLPLSNKQKTHVTEKRNPYEKWFKFREKLLETDVKREAMIKEITEFLRKLLPKIKSHQHFFPKIDSSIIGEQTPSIISEQTPRRRFERETVPVFPSTSDTGDDIYVETQKNCCLN